ncbi:hypothetical protein GCM10008940_06410 [Microbulbifer agarilyticus]
MNGQEGSAAITTAAGVGMTQVPVSPVQLVGLIVASLGLIWNVYATVTRNKHNKFVRDQAKKAEQLQQPVNPPRKR